MSLSEKEQERYARLAALEEQPEEEPTPGSSSVHGAHAAVTKAAGGRPRVGGSVAGDGESPTLRVRVTPDRKHDIIVLRHQLGMKHDSDVIRAAIDEFVDRHLQASA